MGVSPGFVGRIQERSLEGICLGLPDFPILIGNRYRPLIFGFWLEGLSFILDIRRFSALNGSAVPHGISVHVGHHKLISGLSCPDLIGLHLPAENRRLCIDTDRIFQSVRGKGHNAFPCCVFCRQYRESAGKAASGNCCSQNDSHVPFEQ